MKLVIFSLIFFVLILNPCRGLELNHKDGPFFFIFGTVQDAGSPHIACTNECCRELFSKPDKKRKVVCLGLIDPENEKNYIFEATPASLFR